MDPSDLSNHPVVRMLLDQVNVLQQRLAQLESRTGDLGSPLGKTLLIRRGGTNADGSASAKQWKEFTVVNGGLTEFVDGRGCDDDSAPSALIPPGDVELAVALTDGDAVRYVPMVNWFRVDLSQDGGHNGNKTTAADYTYTARVPGSAVIIGTGMTPLMPPRTNGTREVATLGWVYYDSNGALGLALCDEKPGTGGC